MNPRDEGFADDLLEQAKALVNCTDAESREANCVLIECLRSDGAKLAAHRCILDLSSIFFSGRLAQLNGSSDPSSGPVVGPLPLDVSEEVMRHVLYYIYKRRRPDFDKKLLLELYSASKRFGLRGLTEELLPSCRLAIHADDVNFLAGFKWAGDLDILVELYENLLVRDEQLYRLMLTINQWGVGDPVNSQAAAGSCKKLLSALVGQSDQQQRPAPSPAGPAPYAGPTGATSLANMPLISMAAIAPPKIVCMQTLRVLTVFPDCVNANSFIVYDSLYVPENHVIKVFKLTSRDVTSFTYPCMNMAIEWSGPRSPQSPIRCIEMPNGECVVGSCASSDTVYVYTAHSIYALDKVGDNLTMPFTQTNIDLSVCGVFPLLATDVENAFIVESREPSRVVFVVTFETGSKLPPSVNKLLAVPQGMRVAGCYEGRLYFVQQEGATCWYSVLSESDFHRTAIDICCKTIEHQYVLGSVLYLDYTAFVAGEKHPSNRRIAAIDLKSGAMLFQREASQLGSPYIRGVMPALLT